MAAPIRTIYLTLLCTTLAATTPLFSQEIKDVPLSDSQFNTIRNAVSSGYIPLNSDNAFTPDAAVTRKEMATIIDKLLNSDTRLELTKFQIQELLGLSKTFKSQLIDTEKTHSAILAKQKELDDEQKAIHGDISSMSESLSETQKKAAQANAAIQKIASGNTTFETLKKENDDQHFAMWIAILVSLVFGVVK